MKKCICSGLLILLVLCLVACAVVEENYFSYLEKDFCAEVRGEMNGSAFFGGRCDVENREWVSRGRPLSFSRNAERS